MLSAERNAFMTQVGPGTPMGELFRRFWLPIMPAEQLPAADCPPMRTRILGEDLVAFRDTNGQVGVLEAFCPHRRAPLFFGRNEECGLRCVYHGWKFDVDGTCVDMPSEPADSDFKEKVTVQAYPARDWGGAIWVYMGPPDSVPELPRMEWATLPPEQRSVGTWIVESNYLQVLDGNVDTAHVSFLHAAKDGIPGVQAHALTDKAPKLMVMETDGGFAYGGRRTTTTPGEYYWRVTQFLLPMYTLIPGQSWPRGCVGVVPIDDHHTLRVQVSYNPFAPLPNPRRPMTARQLQQFTFRDGTIIDAYVPTEQKSNTYGLDREMQRTVNFTGIAGVETQDRAMTEGMGYICDRTKEHLGTSDLAVIAARRILERLATDLQQGNPPAAASNPEVFGVRPLDVVAAEEQLDRLLARYASDVRVPAGASS